MKRAAWAVVMACLVAGCVRTSEGTPVAGEPPVSAAPAPSSKVIPTPETDLTEPGVVPTERRPVPVDATTCAPEPPPPVGATATVPDPEAPKITVALPTDWAVSAGSGDVGVRMTGPDGATASVTIAATQLDPAAAFRDYSDQAMAASSVSSVSVLPADLCGYSGQKLLGSWSASPKQAVKFADRLAHIWTNTRNYLVAVHVEGPADAPGFDPFSSPLMDDFGIVIP